jgi:tetratricopeptide (TPR) repeat protein
MFLCSRSLWLLATLIFCPVCRPAAQGNFEDLLKKGVALSQQADYAEAIPVLERARQLAPRHYLINLLLGVDLLRSGHPGEAIGALQVAAAVHPKDETAEGYLGEAETALDELALAAEAFQSAVSRAPNSEEALLGWANFAVERFRVIGVSLRSSEKGRAAVFRVEAEGTADGTTAREELLRQSALADPEQNGIWGELGVSQVQLGRRSEGEASLKTARERQPNASATWQLEALMEAAAGNWSEAEKRLLALAERSPVTLRRALAEWPRILVPYQNTGGTIWRCVRERSVNCSAIPAPPEAAAGQGGEQLFGEERWERLVAMPAPPLDQPSAWLWRGVALGELGNCSLAVPALERGLKDNLEVAGFWLEICYGSEAERAAARLTAQGSLAAVHQIRGDMLLRMKGDAAAAVTEYAEARRAKPKDPDLSERLAQAYLALGEMARAKQFATEALSDDPHRKLALRLLAIIAMSERDYPRALAVLKKMMAMDPQDNWIGAQMGIAYAQTGQPGEAVRYLEPVLAAGYPDEKGALHAMLAGALHKLGREQDAKVAAEEASRLANVFQEHAKTSRDDHQ